MFRETWSDIKRLIGAPWKVIKPLKSGNYLTCPECGESFGIGLRGYEQYSEHFQTEHLGIKIEKEGEENGK